MCITDCMQTTFFKILDGISVQTGGVLQSITKGLSTKIKHYVPTTFHHWTQLTWNCAFDESIYYVWYGRFSNPTTPFYLKKNKFYQKFTSKYELVINNSKSSLHD